MLLGVAVWMVGLAACGGSKPAPAKATTVEAQPQQADEPAASDAAPQVTQASNASGSTSRSLVGPGIVHSVPTPFTFELNPPTDSKEHFIAWMVQNRSEDPKFLGERWDRYQAMIAAGDLLNEQTRRAFLLTPREEFVRKISLTHSYEPNFLDIGFGVTISGPHAVGRMTSVLDVKPSDKVLEIGTGSGYMAALLAHRAQRVISLEINPELAQQARLNLQKAGIHNAEVRQADGTKGAPEEAPFDVIVLSGSVAEVPPALLAQLKVGGRLIGIVGDEPVMRVTRISRSAEAEFKTTELWDTVAPRLLNFPEPSHFSF